MTRALSLYLPHWPIDLVRRRLRQAAAAHEDHAGRDTQDAHTSRIASRAMGTARASPHTPRPSHHRPSPSHHKPNSPQPALILLVTTVANRRLVTHCCRACSAAGVHIGMTLAHAQALLPTPTANAHKPLILPANPDADAAALHALAVWATRFAPLVEPGVPDGLLLDITGCQRYFGGEDRLLTRIAGSMRRLSIDARIAIAPTFAAAWAVARFAPHPHSIVSDRPDALHSALAPLPVAALRIETATVEALEQIAITHIHHLLDLPRSALPSRFGDELVLRLDQALGQAMESITPVRAIEPVQVQQLFAGPTTQFEAVQLATRQLVDQLAEALLHREAGVRRLELTLQRSDLPPATLEIVLSRPSRQPRHLWSLIVPRLEKMNLGHANGGGVERIILTALRMGRLPHEQSEVWLLGDAQRDLAKQNRQLGELLDVLGNRLGAQRVTQRQAVESHLPEATFVTTPAGSAAMDDARPAVRRSRKAASAHAILKPQTASPGQPRISHAQRPSQLLDEPEPIDVIAVTPDGPPAWLCWRGQEHRLIAGLGPERIEEPWWHQAIPSHHASTPSAASPATDPAAGSRQIRDYYRVEREDGVWLWIYRQWPSNCWFLHGRWA